MTGRRLEVLQWIRNYSRTNEWCPTVREVASAFGWTSTSTAHYYLIVLEKDGLLKRGPGPRQLRLTDKGKEATL